MPCDGAGGHSVDFSTPNSLMENSNMLAAPAGVVALHDHHVSGLDEHITAIIPYLGTQDRWLMAFDDPTTVRMNWVCQIPEVKMQMSMLLAKWVAGHRDLAGEITASISRMFNWEDVRADTYRKEIDKLLDRRR